MARAIVLSGGGSKGAYQIGVWKALRKLDISYDIVTGTSVGALNAVLMVQRDYIKAVWLWYNMSFKKIFKNKISGDYYTKEGKNLIYKTYAHAILDGGMNIEQLEMTVQKALNVKKVYHSPIDFGIVTVKYPELKPLQLRKNNIPKTLLKDYLIASASCFPAFQKKKIGNSQYIDGGLYDNLPINLAIDMGATEVIAVDLEEIGRKRKVKNQNIPITYISPNNDIGSFLIFDKTMARRCMRFGYYDAMKVYGKLDGKKYTFKQGQLQQNYDKYFNQFVKNFRLCLPIASKNIFLENMMKISVLKCFIEPVKNSHTYQLWNKEIEHLGEIFHQEECKIYNIHHWNKQIIAHYQMLQQDPVFEQEIKKNQIKKWLHNEYTVHYLCDLMMHYPKKQKSLSHLCLLFPHEFLQAVYIKTIMEDAS